MADKVKKIKYLHDGPYTVQPGSVKAGTYYVKAWKEDRTTIAVQVWPTPVCRGQPQGDWAMPAQLMLNTAIEQSILQTDFRTRKKK